jgi:phage shock protein PspC (stress-responsive transcriptional regulator)
VLTLLSLGIGVIASIVAWLLIPEEREEGADIVSVTQE